MLRPPAWDWAFFEDGSLALDRHELWEEPDLRSAEDVSQSPPARPPLHRWMTSVSFSRMPSPRTPGRSQRVPRRKALRRLQRAAALTVITTVVVVTLLLTAFGSSAPRVEPVSAQPRPLGSSGMPVPQIVATYGAMRVQMPIAQNQVTAIGYHGAGEGALRLDPLGRRGNEGVLGRLRDRLFGAEKSALVWYQLGGGSGAATSGLNVGATKGTDVFAPVDGTVVGIAGLVVDRRRVGVRVEIQPASAPSLVISVDRLKPDPALTVGSTVVAAKTRLGTVLDMSRFERQALARYTQDAGNHVTLSVRPAATLSLP